MANLYDVAKRAGVSKTLVSRVINHQTGVSPQSKEKITQAMRELHYTPNGLARSLVLQKTSTVAVVLDSLCEPYFFELINGIEHEIANYNYHVIFCSGQDLPKLKEEYISFFASGRTDGVIIYGSSLNDIEVIREPVLSNFPVVVVENEPEGIALNNVLIENEYGSQLITEHLLSLGCRRILHITGSMSTKAAIHRKDGFLRTMAQHGLADSASILECSQFGIQQGREAINSYLSARGSEPLPDAIYFGADNTAFGGMLALLEAGYSIPRDLRVAGFDDDSPYSYGIGRELPGLTTIRQPLQEAGKTAVRLLLEQINEPDRPVQRIVLYPELIIRESTTGPSASP